MATEKRLIDANAFKVFLENVRQCCLEEDTFSSDFAAQVIETVQDEYLTNAPTVDAVEVVRCKDCKYCDPENHHCDHYTATILPLPRKPDGFCSYGELRCKNE